MRPKTRTAPSLCPTLFCCRPTSKRGQPGFAAVCAQSGTLQVFIKAVIIMMRTRWWCARLVCGFLFILSATLNSWVEPSQL
jgi:hypothetical protein